MALFKEDKRAAFIGLIVTTALLVAISFTIVQLTNAKYAGHKAAAGAPAAEHK